MHEVRFKIIMGGRATYSGKGVGQDWLQFIGIGVARECFLLAIQLIGV